MTGVYPRWNILMIYLYFKSHGYVLLSCGKGDQTISNRSNKRFRATVTGPGNWFALQFRELSLDVRLAAPKLSIFNRCRANHAMCRGWALRRPRCCVNLRSVCNVSWPLQGAIWASRHQWDHRLVGGWIQLFWIERRDTRIWATLFWTKVFTWINNEQVHVTESTIL